MLIDENKFLELEKEIESLHDVNTFSEQNNGIAGKMMLTVEQPPAESNMTIEENEIPIVASFDFNDCAMGIVFNSERNEPVSGIWVIRQSDFANPPQQEIFPIFAECIMRSIDESGKLRIPFAAIVAKNGQILTV